jgi:hypothetical protein
MIFFWILANIIVLQTAVVLGGRLAIFFFGRFRLRDITHDRYTFAVRLPCNQFCTWILMPNEVMRDWTPTYDPQTLYFGKCILGLLPAFFVLCLMNSYYVSWTTFGVATIVGLLHMNRKEID